MFRSKGFTAAFCILAILIIGLSVVLGILLFSGDGASLISGQSIISGQTTAAESESTDSSDMTDTEETDLSSETASTDDYTLRALTQSETHKYPVIGEELEERGVLTIIRSGDDGEGLCFHKLPRFDSMSTSGNLVNYSGSFDIVAKVYVTDNGRPCLMYRTDDGYYVTGSDYYVSYESDTTPTVPADVTKVVSYGFDENQGVVITVYQDDGNTLALSFFDYDGSSTEVRLGCVIAEYTSDGTAHFEYHNTDGTVSEGTITFETPSDGYVMKQITVTFDSPVAFASGEISNITLHN